MSDTLRTVQRTLAQAMALLGPMERPTSDQLEEVHALIWDAAQALNPLIPPTVYLHTCGDPETVGRQFCVTPTPSAPRWQSEVALAGETIGEVIARYAGYRRIWMDEPNGLPESEIVFGTPEAAS